MSHETTCDANAGRASPRRASLLWIGALLLPVLPLLPPMTSSPSSPEGTLGNHSQARTTPTAVALGTMSEPIAPVAAPAKRPARPGRVGAGRGPVDPLAAARAAPSPAEEPCPPVAAASAGLFLMPQRPRPGDTLRLVAVARHRRALGQLQVTLGGAPLEVTAPRRFRAPPEVLEAQVQIPRAGPLHVRLAGREPHHTGACVTVTIPGTGTGSGTGSGTGTGTGTGSGSGAGSAVATAAATPPPTYAPFAEVWPVTRGWDRHLEDLFSAWVARLFHVAPGGQGGWLPLHQLTRDPSRNWLHNALGYREDDPTAPAAVVLLPDCGDLPYFLRAYFSWKLGLPFTFQRCTRGNALTGPECPVSRDNLTTRYAKVHHPVRRFNAFAREWIGWGVHSGTARTTAADDQADFYPVALTRDTLRPGRIFVDPSGHVFVLSQQVPGSERQLGVLFGVDAHPDRTISRKRFAPGTFVFDARVKTGGFKAFRPVVYEGGRIRRLTNAELMARPDLADFSTRQPELEHTAQFYAAVQRALNPLPVDPRDLLRSKILALHEAALERVKAVETGVRYMERTAWKPIPMPQGPAIFETEGPWEVYSTPARDMRLLMAIQDVLDFPRQVARERAHFRIPAAWSSARLYQELHGVHQRLTTTLQVTYRRSDGTPQVLSLAELIARRERLRAGYHPNDCPERRWGAPAGSDELRPCQRHAAPDQREQMRRYEVWFQRLRRPNLRG